MSPRKKPERDLLNFSHSLKYIDERDFSKFPVDDLESWMELEFFTSDNEQEQLKEEYKSNDKILKMRRYFKSNEKELVKANQSNIYAYENGILSKNL